MAQTAEPPNHGERESLAVAVVEAMAEHGYDGLAAADIAARAGLTEERFHEHFTGVQEAALATFDLLFEMFLGRLERTCKTQAEWPLKVKVAIGASLDLAAASPLEAQFLALDALSSNRELARRALDARDRLVSLLARGRDQSPHGAALPKLTEQVLIAGLVGALNTRLATGEANRLPELAPELVELTLLFYLDHEEARKVARRPKPDKSGSPS